MFESDRDGGQQIYVMNADGSGQQRISFGKGRYSTPVGRRAATISHLPGSAGGVFPSVLCVLTVLVREY